MMSSGRRRASNLCVDRYFENRERANNNDWDCVQTTEVHTLDNARRRAPHHVHLYIVCGICSKHAAFNVVCWLADANSECLVDNRSQSLHVAFTVHVANGPRMECVQLHDKKPAAAELA